MSRSHSRYAPPVPHSTRQNRSGTCTPSVNMWCQAPMSSGESAVVRRCAAPGQSSAPGNSRVGGNRSRWSRSRMNAEEPTNGPVADPALADRQPRDRLPAVGRAPRDDEHGTRGGLLDPCVRHPGDPAGGDDPVVRRSGGMAPRAVADDRHRYGPPRRREAAPRSLGDGRIDLDRHHVARPEPVGEQGRVPAGSRADLQHPVPLRHAEGGEHREHHRRHGTGRGRSPAPGRARLRAVVPHWVVSGMSLCTFSHHSAGSVRRSITSPCRLPPAVPGHSRSGTNAARGTAR